MEPKKLFNNQRHIRPIKLPMDKYHAPYAFFNVEARKTARITLSGAAFKLYDYFSTYAPTYHEYISAKNIIAQTGISERSYRNAFDELERYGYLQHDPKTEDKDYYVFVENAMQLKKTN